MNPRDWANKRFSYSLITLILTALFVWVLFTFWGDLVRPVFKDKNTVHQYSRTLEEMREPGGLWLSGLPSYSAFSIPLPSDVEVSSAVVKLNLITDVSVNAIASLGIKINGVRVYERMLPSGRQKLELEFPLDYRLNRGKAIRVAMNLNGEVGGIICLDDEGIGGVVQVLPSSGIRVELAEPLFSVRDAIAMMPTAINIALPTTPANKEWMELASALGVHLSHLDYDIRFHPLGNIPEMASRFEGEGLIVLGDIDTLISRGLTPHISDQSDTPIDNDALPGHTSSKTGNPGKASPDIIASRIHDHLVLGFTTSDTHLVNQLIDNPILSLASRSSLDPKIINGLRSSINSQSHEVSLSSFGIDGAVRQVRFRRNWNLHYAIPDLPGGDIPARLQVRIRMPDGPEDFINLIHVELNDTLIGSQRIEAPGDSNLIFDLPRQAHRMRNKLQITLQRHRDDHNCEVPDATFPVQLLPESSLLMPEKPSLSSDGFTDLPHHFNQGLETRLPSQYLGRAAPETLSALLPILSEFLAFSQTSPINIVTAESNEIPDRPFLAYQHVPAGTEAIIYQPMHSNNGKRIVVDSSGNRVMQDMNLIDKAIAVEQVRSRKPIDTRRNLFKTTHGLLVTRTEHIPAIVHADFGWENVLVLPERDESFEIRSDGYVPLREDMRRDKGVIYELKQ